MSLKRTSYKGILPFELQISYLVSKRGATNSNVLDSHVHDECEIYVNVEGDISFMVEDKIYPVSRANAIISKPYEYHHCIYNSDRPFSHFWILFSCHGNETLFPMFFDRENGEKNLVILSKDEGEELLKICFELIEEKSEFEVYSLFFRMITLLSHRKDIPSTYENTELFGDIKMALEFINKNFSSNFKIEDVANYACVSVNTLERHFTSVLRNTPSEYIRNLRLSHAAKLLKEGKSVLDASLESGFCDCSHFVSLFKRKYGVTPLKYKKK